ncbi:VOC family protein [Streptomyces qinzhouensis]|uniref:VOC family protein n=1 Tax=Streptomyces qinzhouensis TaxID=2599401 RepID=UPI001FE7082B|nr:hypothetical protein [Streptomyces qinzhouensis]
MPVLATLARVYVDDLDTALPTFAELTGEQPWLRFGYGGLELAAVGGYLLLAGEEKDLAPYRGTHATVIVDSLGPVLRIVEQHGGTVLDGPDDVPTGRNLTVRHPGGATVEYVEFHAAARSLLDAGAPAGPGNEPAPARPGVTRTSSTGRPAGVDGEGTVAAGGSTSRAGAPCEGNGLRRPRHEPRRARRPGRVSGGDPCAQRRGSPARG